MGYYEFFQQEFHFKRSTTWIPITMIPNTVADPGFPVGGVPSRLGGANLQRGYFLAKMYAKMKELDPVGGGRAPAVPP